MKEQIWFQAVLVPLSVPNEGAALDTEAKRVMWDGVAVLLKSIPSSASTPCTTRAKALPGHLHLLQHTEVLWYKESGSGWETLSFLPPHIGETAWTREPSCLAANKPSSQQDPTADMGMSHLTTIQPDDSISTVTSTPCLHHPLK